MAKILVVDDEELIRTLLKEVLTQNGHDVVEASDGDTCVEMARSNSPDLVLLDMVMPKMTGMEVAPILRAHPGTKKTPIIALTGDTTTESIEAAHNAGCDYYLKKPIDSAKLLGTINKALA